MHYYEDNESEKRVNQLIHEFFNSPELRKKYTSSKIKTEWKEIVGNFIASRTVDVKTREGVLYIKLNSSSLKNEMMLMRETLLQRINEHLGENFIKEIKIS